MAALDASVSPRVADVRPWRVLHVCEAARQVWPVVEGQLAVGMHPSVVTPSGFRVVVEPGPPPAERPRPLSLLDAWHDVRGWRQSMLEASASSAAEIVHAHTFASGMAGVRNCPVVVYDIHAFVEEMGADRAAPDSRPWLSRSFRVAEQFIVSRAAAVVVHGSDMRMRAFERGALPDNVFVVPSPADLESDRPPRFPDAIEDEVVFFAAELCASSAAIAPEVFSLLRSFSLVAAECPNCSLGFAALPEAMRSVIEVAQSLGIAGRLRLCSPADAAAALASATVVIAGGRDELAAVAAFRHGRVLLAADLPAVRDVTAEGRGCLWYDPRDPRDLARRAAFLARNPNFRNALAVAGYDHLRATRSPAAVGRHYDAVYRHAVRSRRTMNAATGAALVPIRASF